MSRYSDFCGLLTKGKSLVNDKDVRDTNWSPNNIRTVIISENKALIEHYTVEGSANGNWIEEVELKASANDKTSVLKEFMPDANIVYSAIEEIVVIADKHYHDTALRLDFTYKGNGIGNILKSEEFLNKHPRFYGLTSLSSQNPRVYSQIWLFLKDYIMQTKGRSRMHIYDLCMNKMKSFVVQSFCYICEANVKEEENKKWWRAGIDDLEILGGGANQVLRPHLYSLDAYPEHTLEDKPDSMPIYKAFRRIGKPYIEKITIDAQQEETLKQKLKNQSKNSERLDDDLERVAKKAEFFKGAYDFLFKAHEYANKAYFKQSALLEKDKNFEVAEGHNKSTEMDVEAMTTKDLMTARALLSIYLSNNDDSKARDLGNLFNTIDGNYCAYLCKGVSPDLAKIGYAINRGLKLYYTSDIRFANNGQVAYLKNIVDGKGQTYSVKDNDDKAKLRLNAVNNYLHNNTTPDFNSLELPEEEVTMRVTDFLTISKYLLDAEVLTAYSYFLRTLPFWYTNHSTVNENVLVLVRAGSKIPYGEPIIWYNDDILDRLELFNSSLNSCFDWKYELKALSITKYKNGNLFKSIDEYSRYVFGLYEGVFRLIDSILE